MVLHCMYCTESVVVLYLIRTGLVKGRLVKPWLWVGIPISTLVGERGVCISAQYKHNITYSVDYMGNINQYTCLYFPYNQLVRLYTYMERIKQHIPDKLYKKPPDKRVATSDSAITKHLQAQPGCIPQERNGSFSVITPARNSAHRFTLEALYIRSLRPELCRQKKHIKVVRLFKLQPD